MKQHGFSVDGIIAINTSFVNSEKEDPAWPGHLRNGYYNEDDRGQRDGWRVFADLAKLQPFQDGNKRTALIAANAETAGRALDRMASLAPNRQQRERAFQEQTDRDKQAVKLATRKVKPLFDNRKNKRLSRTSTRPNRVELDDFQIHPVL